MSKMKEEKVSNGLVINKDIGILYTFLWFLLHLWVFRASESEVDEAALQWMILRK